MDGEGPAHEDFTGRIALVTGAGSGIGAAVARRLAAQGSVVLVADIDAAAARAVTKELPERWPVTVDVGDGGQVDRVFDEAVREYGRLDVVVHAAGVDDPG